MQNQFQNCTTALLTIADVHLTSHFVCHFRTISNTTSNLFHLSPEPTVYTTTPRNPPEHPQSSQSSVPSFDLKQFTPSCSWQRSAASLAQCSAEVSAGSSKAKSSGSFGPLPEHQIHPNHSVDIGGLHLNLNNDLLYIYTYIYIYTQLSIYILCKYKYRYLRPKGRGRKLVKGNVET